MSAPEPAVAGDRRGEFAVTEADAATRAPANGAGGTVLAFLNEVAGGRKLLEAVRERVDAGRRAGRRRRRRRTSRSPARSSTATRCATRR